MDAIIVGASRESPEAATVGTSDTSGSDVAQVFKDNLPENTKCEECGFIVKSSQGLKIHTSTHHRISPIAGANNDEEIKSKLIQTDETWSFCIDFIESK